MCSRQASERRRGPAATRERPGEETEKDRSEGQGRVKDNSVTGSSYTSWSRYIATLLPFVLASFELSIFHASVLPALCDLLARLLCFVGFQWLGKLDRFYSLGPESKSFRLCGPHRYENKRAWLWSNKTSFIRQGQVRFGSQATVCFCSCSRVYNYTS